MSIRLNYGGLKSTAIDLRATGNGQPIPDFAIPNLIVILCYFLNDRLQATIVLLKCLNLIPILLRMVDPAH